MTTHRLKPLHRRHGKIGLIGLWTAARPFSRLNSGQLFFIPNLQKSLAAQKFKSNAEVIVATEDYFTGVLRMIVLTDGIKILSRYLSICPRIANKKQHLKFRSLHYFSIVPKTDDTARNAVAAAKASLPPTWCESRATKCSTSTVSRAAFAANNWARANNYTCSATTSSSARTTFCATNHLTICIIITCTTIITIIMRRR